ncbi:MAG: class I SAM-dependent methyltransferase [Chloroflexota bacterium]|nr:class I SAM-dependent methyltransferase [Chloroflexota bacterium]
MDTADIRRFKEQVWEEWTDSDIVAGWSKWYPKFAVQSQAVTEALIEAAGIQRGMEVLDLASGPGDPAITLAKWVAPSGHVMATDLSPGMVAAAASNARKEGIDNIGCQQADAEALPFPDQAFDAVTCRFGIMFCMDVQQALDEIYRVLKPGGQAAFAVWGPPSEQSFIAITMNVLSQYAPLPACEIGAPNMFNFARTGSISTVLLEAGFQQVEERFHRISMPWPGPPEEYSCYIQETAGPARQVLKTIAPEQRKEVICKLTEEYRRYHDGACTDFPAAVIVASGQRRDRQDQGVGVD